MSAAALACYGLTFRYGGKPVLDEVSVEIARGRVTALLGPNGSGKSTLLKLLAGVLPLRRGRGSSGTLWCTGLELSRFSAERRGRQIAYVAPDLRAEFPLNAREAVLIGRGVRSGVGSGSDADAVHAAMERAFCWGLRDRDLHTLSGGERQLVAVSRALAQGARILLLDETLSRMDLHHQAKVGGLLRRLVREEGYAVVLVAHDLNLASEWADDCVLLERGRRVAAGPLAETLTAANLAKLYPGAGIQVAPSPASGAPKVFFGPGESRG